MNETKWKLRVEMDYIWLVLLTKLLEPTCRGVFLI